MTRPTLYIGNKNYSSWSMRPWLALRMAGVDFEEVLIPLGGEGYGARKIAAVRAVSPSGTVPALAVDGVTLWDSLAIAEWAAEQRPDAGLWPADPSARAVCRSVVAEMHAGFAALRNEASMNIRRRTTPRAWSPACLDDLARLATVWSDTRARWGGGGPWLFGARTLADVFFTPVATRLRTYGIALDETSMRYAEALLAHPDFIAWERAALDEPWSIAQTEAL